MDHAMKSLSCDPAAKAAAYVDAFMQNINWANAARRLPAIQGGAV